MLIANYGNYKQVRTCLIAGLGFEPRSLAHETSEEPLLYPAIINGRISISYAGFGLGNELWTGDKSSIRATAATSPHYPFIWCIGGLHHFLEFRKPVLKPPKNLVFSKCFISRNSTFLLRDDPDGT